MIAENWALRRSLKPRPVESKPDISQAGEELGALDPTGIPGVGTMVHPNHMWHGVML